MKYPSILLCLFGVGFLLAGVAIADETSPRDLPALDEPSAPPPTAVPAPLPQGDTISVEDSEELRVLRPDERALIMREVDLHVVPITDLSLTIKPEVYDERGDGVRVPILPPPMRKNIYYVSDIPALLNDPNWNGVEDPYYVPVSPFCYEPLYFEEPYLERYGDGHRDGLQSILSGTLFYARIPLLPLKMLKADPHEPQLYIWADIVDPAWGYR